MYRMNIDRKKISNLINVWNANEEKKSFFNAWNAKKKEKKGLMYEI